MIFDLGVIVVLELEVAGLNRTNKYTIELRQKICLHIYVVVLLTCLPSLDGKRERFVTKKWQK